MNNIPVLQIIIKQFLYLNVIMKWYIFIKVGIQKEIQLLIIL